MRNHLPSLPTWAYLNENCSLLYTFSEHWEVLSLQFITDQKWNLSRISIFIQVSMVFYSSGDLGRHRSQNAQRPVLSGTLSYWRLFSQMSQGSHLKGSVRHSCSWLGTRHTRKPRSLSVQNQTNCSKYKLITKFYVLTSKHSSVYASVWQRKF